MPSRLGAMTHVLGPASRGAVAVWAAALKVSTRKNGVLVLGNFTNVTECGA